MGIHIRLKKGMQDVLDVVDALDIRVAQSFLITESNKYISFSDRVIQDFVKQKQRKNFLYFVHAAYWSGLHSINNKMFESLRQEIAMAQDLQSDGVVVHVGASKTKRSAVDKVRYVAEAVNTMTSWFPNMNILLENAPHAGRNFGGDLQDFLLLFDHLERKDQVKFCIDTAHAFVFGYDIAKEDKMNDFLQFIDHSIGKQHIALLHFNDSVDSCGSYIDKHEIPGHGQIGKKALEIAMNHELFKDTPIIMEIADFPHDECKKILKDVSSWDR